MEVEPACTCLAGKRHQTPDVVTLSKQQTAALQMMTGGIIRVKPVSRDQVHVQVSSSVPGMQYFISVVE